MEADKASTSQTDNEEGAGATVEEEKDSGTVKLFIYKLYTASIGTWLSILIVISLLLMQVKCL